MNVSAYGGKGKVEVPKFGIIQIQKSSWKSIHIFVKMSVDVAALSAALGHPDVVVCLSICYI